MAKLRNIGTLTIDSTVLCCNFVNTVSSWKGEKKHDYLESYNDFVAWCAKLEVSDLRTLDMLRQLAAVQPEEAMVALVRVKEIREVIRGLISAVAHNDNDEKSKFLPAANLLLVDAVSRQRLLYVEGKFLMGQVEAPGDLSSPVWKVVNSLASLLTGQEAVRIKECPSCGWVFLDETRNGKRKWCNPQSCGSTDKMMRYNQRKKNNIVGE